MIPSDHSDSLPTHIAGGCECDVASGGFGNERRVGKMMAILYHVAGSGDPDDR